jgi:hypothetical protein
MKIEAPGIRIQQRKGDGERLKGKLIAYVRIATDLPPVDDGSAGFDSGEMSSAGPVNPLSSMVRNGILAVQANYVDQRNIRDFFRAEFGISLEKGIQEVIEQAKETGGLEGALDPEAVRERLESMKNADFIPIPAKVAFFNSEEEMMANDVDVYYLGRFTVITHAHLCVNSFPIIYQAYFREQEHKAMESEIASLLGTIENPKTGGSSAKMEAGEPTIHNFTGDLKAFLLKDLIPKMIYNLSDLPEYTKAKKRFRDFMDDFGYPEDLQEIIILIESTPTQDAVALRKLELLVAKVEALHNEDYEQLEDIRNQLAKLT